jgi:hypothetical protein
LKMVHFYSLRKRIHPTKVTPPIIANHTKIKVLSMKFIPSLKLYNKGINRCLSRNQSTYMILWKLVPFSPLGPISPFNRVRGIPFLSYYNSQRHLDPLNCVYFKGVTYMLKELNTLFFKPPLCPLACV